MANAASLEKSADEVDELVSAESREPDTEDYGLITRYLARELSAADRERVEERLRTDPKFRALAEPIIMIWKAPLPLDRAPDRADEIAAEAAVQRLRERMELHRLGIRKPTLEERRTRRRRIRRNLFLTIGGLITGSLFLTLRPQWVPKPAFYLHADAPVDAQRVARLPDETQVTLAAGSHLQYPKVFSPFDVRSLDLDGIGTFTVPPTARQPLTVKGAGVEVKVLSGRFTVVSYNTMPVAFVKVYEGEAEVRARTVYGLGQVLTLHAGEAARVGPGLLIDRGDAPIPVSQQGAVNPPPAPAAAKHVARKDTTVHVRPIVRVTPETTLADAIARDFGERPRQVAFGGRDTINIVFWNPSFWQDVDSKAFPMKSLDDVVDPSAMHIAGFVWRTFGKEAGFQFVRIVFVRVAHDRKLVDPTHEEPVQEVIAWFTSTMIEAGEKPAVGVVLRGSGTWDPRIDSAMKARAARLRRP